MLHPYRVLKGHAEKRGEAIAMGALRLGSQSFEDFKTLTWAEVLTKVHQYIHVFREAGVKTGDRVAIRGYNGIEWVCADWACLAAGIVSVPLYQSSHIDEVRYILNEAEVKLFVSEKEIPEFRIPQLSFSALEERAAAQSSDFQFNDFSLKNLATIIYTSGTLGQPKGVMHTYEGIMGALETANALVKVSSRDRLVSYLPLCHVAERMLVEFGSLVSGASIHFVDKVERVVHYLPKIQPTIFLAVPRIWDMIYFRLSRELSQNQMLQQRLSAIPRFLRNWILAYFVRRKLGLHKTRYCFSGAAKLSKETSDSLRGFGIEIHEAYGLTETLCVSTLSPLGRPVSGSCGRLYPGVVGKIAEDGEILLKSPYHFFGYYKHPEWTAEAIDQGWFHTGDVGHFDKKGNLFITDRKKNLFKNSGGKYVAPQVAEGLLKTHAMIREVVVFGEDKPYCVALASVDFEQGTEKELIALLESVNSRLAPHEQIKVLGFTTRPWAVETGELTPSFKVKRKVVLQRYTEELEFLYNSRLKVQEVDSVREGSTRRAHSGL